MGYVLATGYCFACKQVFSFNPVAVPSITVNGSREPACRACMVLVNNKRAAQGMTPHPIRPDAYEPCEETELGG